MNSVPRLALALRSAAAAVLLAGAIVWATNGAHTGWSQTSTVTMQTDEITGIQYPVRKDEFVAGVEVPAAAVLLAGILAGLSFLPRRRQTVQA